MGLYRIVNRWIAVCLASAVLLLTSPHWLDAQDSAVRNPHRSAQANPPIRYPETKWVDIQDDYHGRAVKDPYRWLEDTESEETAAWVAAQNEVTQAYLQSIPERTAMQTRLQQLWNYERYGLPSHRGPTYFYTHNDGLQNQSLLYKADSLAGERMVLIDPNRLSDDGTVALADWVPSDDGKRLAYGLADGGSDWRTWKVRDVATGKDLDDVVRWVKFSSVAWLPDGSGFFYGRYAAPADGELLTGTNENQRLYFHTIGQDQSKDRLILERPDHPKWGFSPEVSDDGRFLVIQNWKGSEPKSQIFIKDLSDPDSQVEPLITGFDAEYQWVASVDQTHYFLTDHEAPRRRLIAVDVDHPDRNEWRQVIAEGDNVLESVSLFSETFYCAALKDARGTVTRRNIDGTLIDELPLPGVGSVAGFGGRQDAAGDLF